MEFTLENDHEFIRTEERRVGKEYLRVFSVERAADQYRED